MISDEYEVRRRLIDAERAATLERKLAFDAVIRFEGDLAEARKKLSFARDNKRPLRDLERRVADLEAQLAEAVAYCRTANPDRLTQHENDKAAAAEQARKDAEQRDAERLAGERRAAARSAAMAEERMNAKIRRQAEDAALMARVAAAL